MARWMDVQFSGGKHYVNGTTYPPLNFTIQLDHEAIGGKKRWRVGRPIPNGIRLYAGNSAMGFYEEDSYGIKLTDEAGQPLFLFERDNGQANAAVDRWFSPMGVPGSWSPTSTDLPGMWYGLVLKGSLDLAVGAEIGVALLNRMIDPRNVTLGMGTARAGLVAGGSAGIAFMLASGFKEPPEFTGFTSSGFDWALSFGPKWSGMAKLSKLAAAIKPFENVLEAAETAKKVQGLGKLMRAPGVGKECYSVAKSVQASYFFDSENQSIVSFDIPLAGIGAELGAFYGWSCYRRLIDW